MILGTALWPYLLAAVALIAAVVLIARASLVPAAPKPDGPPKLKDPRVKDADADSAKEEHKPGGWFSFLHRTRDEQSESFKRNLAALRMSVARRGYQYELPWYVVMGDPGSGKSALLGASGSDFSEGPRYGLTSNQLDWRFLDRGVLLGVPGQFVTTTHAGRDNRQWGRTLELLQRSRPRRPIDGLVLTVSAEWLLSATDDGPLIAAAARYTELLTRAQRRFGFTFPMYIVVTKCDVIEGFGSFCRQLPKHRLDDVFGWSAPWSFETGHKPEWTDNAFDSIGQELEELRNEILVEKGDLPNADEVFLFPSAFQNLRAPLRVFLDRLLRESVYRETFGARGLYFTGEIQPESAPAAAAVPAVIPSPDGNEAEPPSPRELVLLPDAPPIVQSFVPAIITTLAQPSFVRALWRDKIFPERGLARPLPRLLVARSRAVLVMQLSALALALFLGIGTGLACQRLSGEHKTLDVFLNRLLALSKGHAQDTQADLLTAMAPAGNVSFRSVFIPSSWFSPLDDNITTVMRWGIEVYVIDNLRTKLQSRVDTVLKQGVDGLAAAASGPDAEASAGADAGASDAAASGAAANDAGGALNDPPPAQSPEATPQYKALDSFVQDLDRLSESVAVFNNLRAPGQPLDFASVRKLLQYLYGRTMADLHADGHFAKALLDVDGSPFDIREQDRNTAMQVARGMTDNLFANWFGNSLLLTDSSTLVDQVTQLEEGTRNTPGDLQEIQQTLRRAGYDLGNPQFLWVRKPQLDLNLNGSLRRVIVEPIDAKNVFLDKSLIDYANEIGTADVDEVRATLEAATTGVTGPVFELSDQTVALSQGSVGLELALGNALNLRLFAKNDGRRINTVLRADQRLLWRVEPLQEAEQLFDVYQRFLDEAMQGSSPRLRTTLARVARTALDTLAQDVVASSQDFEPRLDTDVALADEVNSFRDSSDLLDEIAGKAKILGLTDIQNGVQRIANAETLALLRVIDGKLMADDPYSVRDGNFNWWDGRGQLSLLAFNFGTSAELADHLATQRDYIKSLEQQAEPLIQFQSTSDLPRSVQDDRLVAKWTQIIADLRQYDGKKPSASVATLEDFILNDLDKINPDKSCSGNTVTGSRDLADYFLQIRADLQLKATTRCKSLGAAQGYDTYSEIADLFNRTLAGHFPFADLAPGKTQPREATLSNVLAFYTLFDSLSKDAGASLKDNALFGGLASQAAQFLDVMGKLRPLVIPAPGATTKTPPLSLEFVPGFRVNRQQEVEGNQIIDWGLQVAGQLFQEHENEHPGLWRPGDPVRLSLRWANDSVYQPEPDPSQPNLVVRDRSAYLEFADTWSLLTFLRSQQAPPSDGSSSQDASSYLLRLHFKTVLDPRWARQPVPKEVETVVYMQLRLWPAGDISVTDRATMDKTAIELPVFPVRAPVLERPASGVSAR